MIEELAQVVRVEGEFAWVETRRASTCGGCAANAGCGTAALGRVLGKRRIQVKTRNVSGISAGDRVVIGVRERALVRGSLVVYAVPLVGLLGGAAVGQDLAGRLLVSNVDFVSIGAGLLGLVAGLAWVWRFTRRIADDTDYQPVILRRTVPADARVTEVMDTGLNR